MLICQNATLQNLLRVCYIFFMQLFFFVFFFGEICPQTLLAKNTWVQFLERSKTNKQIGKPQYTGSNINLKNKRRKHGSI